MWCFDKIDRADPTEHNRFVELEPMMELEVKNDDTQAALMCVVKISIDPENTFWYCQVWANSDHLTTIKVLTNDTVHLGFGLGCKYMNYGRTCFIVVKPHTVFSGL
jgi:hypothetical protein